MLVVVSCGRSPRFLQWFPSRLWFPCSARARWLVIASSYFRNCFLLQYRKRKRHAGNDEQSSGAHCGQWFDVIELGIILEMACDFVKNGRDKQSCIVSRWQGESGTRSQVRRVGDNESWYERATQGSESSAISILLK